MKFLFVMGGDSLGGIERFIANILPVLADQGHQVSLFHTMSRGGYYDEHYQNWAKRIYGPYPGWQGLELVRAMKAAIQQEDPDLIQSFYYWRIPEQVIAARLSGKKYYVSYRSVISGHPLKAQLITYLTSWAVSGYSAISPSVVEHLQKIHRVPLSKIYLTGNGIDLERIQVNAQERTTLHIPNDKKIIGTVGRLEPVKDHQKIVELACLCQQYEQPWHFVWIGDGSCRSHYEEEIVERGLQSFFTLCGNRDVYQQPVYSAFDLFLLTSKHEGFGQVVVEAMASGIPIVASDVAGVKTIVTSGYNGILVRQDDILSYYQSIDAVFSNPELEAQLKQNGLTTARKYTIEVVLQRFYAMWGMAYPVQRV